MPRERRMFKNKIRRLRLLNTEMTQEELGRKLGLSKQAVCAIETGKTIPSLLRAWQISKFFNLTIEEIFYLEDDSLPIT